MNEREPHRHGWGPRGMRARWRGRHRHRHGRPLTLADLSPGELARVADVRADHDPALALRILEIGLVVGTGVRYLRAAPLGDPIEIDIEGTLFSMRRNEAAAVVVEID